MANTRNVTIKTVDFLPEFSVTGDLKKVTEYDILEKQSKIIPIYNNIVMEKGSCQLFPNIGLREEILALSFMEESEVLPQLSYIESILKQTTSVSLSIVVDDNNTNYTTGDLSFQIIVEGLADPLMVTTRRSGLLRVVHPSLFSDKRGG